MVRRNITIGARTFAVAGVTLGTARRVPNALKTATDVIRRQGTAPDESKTLAPSPAELNALIELIHDGIDAAAKATAKETGQPSTAPSVDDLTDLLDALDIAEGLTQMYRAVGTMFDRDETPAEEVKASSGNSTSSESAS